MCLWVFMWYTCTARVCLCRCVCVCVCVSWAWRSWACSFSEGQETPWILLYHPLPLRLGFSADLELLWQPANNPLVSNLHSTAQEDHVCGRAFLFYLDNQGLNSGLHPCITSAITIEPRLQSLKKKIVDLSCFLCSLWTPIPKWSHKLNLPSSCYNSMQHNIILCWTSTLNLRKMWWICGQPNVL